MFHVSEWKCLLWQLHYGSCCCILVLSMLRSRMGNCMHRSCFAPFTLFGHFSWPCNFGAAGVTAATLLHYKRRSFCNVHGNRYGKSIVRRQDDWLAFDNGGTDAQHKEHLMRRNCLRWPRLYDWSLNKRCRSADNGKLTRFFLLNRTNVFLTPSLCLEDVFVIRVLMIITHSGELCWTNTWFKIENSMWPILPRICEQSTNYIHVNITFRAKRRFVSKRKCCSLPMRTHHHI